RDREPEARSARLPRLDVGHRHGQMELPVRLRGAVQVPLQTREELAAQRGLHDGFPTVQKAQLDEMVIEQSRPVGKTHRGALSVHTVKPKSRPFEELREAADSGPVPHMGPERGQGVLQTELAQRRLEDSVKLFHMPLEVRGEYENSGGFQNAAA